MKEKRLAFSFMMLALFALPATLNAQYKYSLFKVLDGRYFAAENNTTHKRGIIDRRIEFTIPSSDIFVMDNYTVDDFYIEDYDIVPVVYDDITIMNIINQNGLSSDVAFCGLSGNKYTVYNGDGIKLTNEINQKAVFMSRMLGANLQLLGLNRADNQGYDLRIIFEQPNHEIFTTITGPYDVSYYEAVFSNGKYYFYIKAKLPNKEEYVKYDVLGNKLSEGDFANIAGYYDRLGNSKWNEYSRLPQADKLKNTGQKVLYEAATVANSSAINEAVRQLYKNEESRSVTSWAENTGLLAQCGEAFYLAGNCYFDGLNIPMHISSARYCYEKAKEFGYSLASKGLEKIDNIERPIALKGGPQPEIDELSDKLEQMAKEGYLEAIETYCHQATFFSFGDAINHNPEELKDAIGDKLAVKVLPLLLAAAPKDANCQFMLACVYAGVEAIGGTFDYRYSFRNPSKAKYWIEQFCANPKKNEARAWGYNKEMVDTIISNIRNLPDN